MKPKILLIEDNPGARFGFVRYFTQEGYVVIEAADLAEAFQCYAAESFDAIILDLNLPDGNGIDFIDAVRRYDSAIAIIVITGSGDVPLAVDAMQRGADNFLTKPVDNSGLAVFLYKTLEIGALKRRQAARQRLETQEEVFFGATGAMQEMCELARIASEEDCPLLITGETGSGKGRLAAWVHRHGKRAQHEFVDINCSGLRGELLARELFGNSRGAYTSADQDRKGLLDIADRGTLFLDEVGDMSPDVQAQFLKVLEEKSYRRLGDIKLLRSDFRLICATNRSIDDLVRSGHFRQDLMYRINLMVISIPPLRERKEELPELVNYLLQELGACATVLSEDVLKLFRSYSWPGNIRELKNVLERALLLTRGKALLPCHFSALTNNRHAGRANGSRTVQEVEEAHILSVLDQLGGDINSAAKSLNLSRATLYRRIKQIKRSNS